MLDIDTQGSGSARTENSSSATQPLNLILNEAEATKLVAVQGTDSKFDSLSILAESTVRLWISEDGVRHVGIGADASPLFVSKFESLQISAPEIVCVNVGSARGLELPSSGLDSLSLNAPVVNIDRGFIFGGDLNVSTANKSSVNAPNVVSTGAFIVEAGSNLDVSSLDVSLSFLPKNAVVSIQEKDIQSAGGKLVVASSGNWASSSVGLLSSSSLLVDGFPATNVIRLQASLRPPFPSPIFVLTDADQPLPVGDISLMPHEAPLHAVEEHTQRVTDLMDSMGAEFAANAKLQFSLKGEDASLFRVSSKGVLSFKDAPEYQIHQDADLDGQYDVTVVATQAKTGQSVEKDVSVCVMLVEMQGTDDNDVLKSGNAWDVIDGLAGDDKLTGGGGRDTFVISAGHDQITDFNYLGTNGLGAEVLNVQEGASVVATLKAAWTATAESNNQGTALLQTLGFDVDLTAVTTGLGWTLQALGKASVNLTGSAGDDTLLGANSADILVGGYGDDWLAGGKGADELTGGAGADTFLISDTNGGKSIDRVTDFESGVDHLRLEGLLFKAPAGVLADSQFAIGAAQDISDRVIYNEQTGQLFWDADGSGRKGAILIAQFDPFDTLRASDILLG